MVYGVLLLSLSRTCCPVCIQYVHFWSYQTIWNRNKIYRHWLCSIVILHMASVAEPISQRSIALSAYHNNPVNFGCGSLLWNVYLGERISRIQIILTVSLASATHVTSMPSAHLCLPSDWLVVCWMFCQFISWNFFVIICEAGWYTTIHTDI